MLKRAILILAAILVLAGCGGPKFRGSVMPEPVAVPDFELTDQTGGRWRLSDQLGDVVLLFFGYTACPDVCPTTLATWRAVHQELGADAERVRFVFVTVDPERDTPEQLARHVGAFHPDFVGLTGSPDELAAVYQVFDVYSQKVDVPQSALGYLVDHTATTFVIDPAGTWRLRETYGTPVEDLVHDVRELLK